jgi:D-alanyl-D-alanine carboxypeptidase (penicillin-binding protein 5/6)
VGEVVAPKSAETEESDSAEPPNTGMGAPAKPAASAKSDSGGIWIALGVTGGVLVLLAAGAFLVNRRWPLPDLVRRLPRR